VKPISFATYLGVLCAIPLASPWAQPGAPAQPPATSPQAATRYTPGWLVQLRTGSFDKSDQLVIDPGVIAAYMDLGPSFAEDSFVKRSQITGIGQPVIAGLASKFVVRSDGDYQLGVRLDYTPQKDWSWVDCMTKFSLNNMTLVEKKIRGQANGQNTIELLKPVVLRAGLYDATLLFGCYGGPKVPPTLAGNLTILVAHAGELAPAPAREGDFVMPADLVKRAPPPSEPGAAPVLQPKQKLPSGLSTY